MNYRTAAAYLRNLVCKSSFPNNIRMKKAIAVLLLMTTFALAKNKKDHPLTGTVVSFHAQAETRGRFDNTGGDIGTYERRIYVIKTDSGTIEITGWDGASRSRKRPPLAVGQVITYRPEKAYIYAVLDDGKEHRFYVMSAE